MIAFRRLLRYRAFQGNVLVLLTLILRIVSRSGPYYSDASRHAHAIESGLLVIHPPGYFLFNVTGLFLSHLLRVSAADALQILNVAFSAAGAAVFYLLVSRLTSIPSPFWLSLAYICSPIVWFAGDIHSTYAAMTFFAPLLILVMLGESRLILGCMIWAVMTGFRQSDGFFVLPWMLYEALRFGWKERLIGVSAAIPLVAVWWIPTAARYRSGLLSPIRYSGDQVNGLAQGVLTGQFNIHAAVNAFHATSGMIMIWGVLTPLVCLGAIASVRNPLARSMTIFVAPGVAYCLLYFISDALYLAYAAAAGMILAGVYLAKWSPKKRDITYALAICVSMIFMICGHTAVGKRSESRAVADAYFLKYSVPSLKEQSDPRLASLLGACDDKSVRGICK
ncbi:MAG TPA: hypothetical protein VGI45_17815 [Terracidiphilus sp.]|jgi:hypothetical protein